MATKRTQRSKSNVRKESSYYAMALSQFLRLQTPQDVATFRRQWPTFFPDHFWAWKIEQRPPGLMDGEAPHLPHIAGWRAWQSVLLEAWREKFPLTESIRLLVAPTAPWADELSNIPVHDFQRAVLLLSIERWRAKFCLQCGQPFAAEKPATRFCSPACFGKSRRAAKRQWWNENRAATKTERGK